MSDDISIIRYEKLPPSGDFLQQKVTFTFGKRSKPVAGILKLVQMLVKMLLTTPGSDHFATDVGTVIQGLFKRAVSASSFQLLKMDIMMSIQDLERQILDIQASQPIPDDERLKEIQIRNVQYLEVSGEWQIQISVLSEAGEQVAFDLDPYLKGK
jgi:hypothetical protein